MAGATTTTGSNLDVLADLEARGLVQDCTHRDELRKLLATGAPVPFYSGYDPTGTSLHVGHFVPISVMMRLQRAGHRPIGVVGGATGMVGDPSGKSDERKLLDKETLARNVGLIRAQLERFLDFTPGPSGAVMANNADWFAPVSFLEFLRDVGKHVTVNYMLAKESVRARLEDREQGISYTEFSYMLLQGYDFAHLAKTAGCRLQIGGSDQWGNITCGIELHRRLGGAEPIYGLVVPLLMTSSGKKFGKTESGTSVWLDPELTSPYAFYQYWFNTEDADVEKYFKMLTFVPLDEIASIVAEHDKDRARRLGQKRLAEEMTRTVHGAEALRRAVAASNVMFGGSVADLTDADLAPLLTDVPHTALVRSELDAGLPLLDLLVRVKLCDSKGSARRLLGQGGVYVNNVRETDEKRLVGAKDLATESMIVLRAGKKSYHVLRIV